MSYLKKWLFSAISYIAWLSSAWIDKSRPKTVGFVNPTGAIHVKWKILLFSLILTLILGSAGFNLFIHSQMAIAATSTPAPADEINFTPSPDGRWMAVVNSTAGSLDLQGPDGQTVAVFPAGSAVGQVVWSPDSRALLVAQNNWIFKEPLGTGVTSSAPIAIWQVDFKGNKAQPARQVFQSNTPLAQTSQGEDNAEQIVFGQWSPHGQTVLFWLGPLGASVLADGLPLFALNVTSGQVSPVVEWALLNPRYQSWSPDSSRLAVTAGADRVAQTNKWLMLWEATTGQSATVISQTEQIPGIVAWSPSSDAIAYAAVPADQTGDGSYHVAEFNNPAIAGRRIYLLDPATGQSRRLNETDTFQDNPLWSDDGTTLYYVERQGDTLQLMAADPQTGQAQPVPGAAMPLPQYVGYYGQSEFDWLLEYRPGGSLAGQPVPTPEVTPTASTDQINETPSPDGRWTASLNQTAGSLTLRHQSDNQSFSVFPSGDTAFAASWSPDSRHLLVVRTNYFATVPGQAIQANLPIEIWQVQFKDDQPTPPTRLYQSPIPADKDTEQIVLGHWSPNSRYIVFWRGTLSASILADGLPAFILDVQSGETYPVVPSSTNASPFQDLSNDDLALANPRYHSWAPDSSMLAITIGGYRSAQVNKWLNLVNPTTGQITTVISRSEQIPGTVAWSPKGDIIAYAAVPADQTSPDWADWMIFDNPAIAARRIYLLDPATGKYHRLNEVESYQDAPVWSDDGTILYYIQRNDDELSLMAADPATGQAEAVPNASEPLDLKDPMRPNGGYYGQFGREELLAHIPADQASAPSDEDQDILRFIFKDRRPEIGTLTDDFLNRVAAGQFSDFQRQEADVNGDEQPEILISGRTDTFYLFVAILKRHSSGQLAELFYTDNVNGKYAGDVYVTVDGQQVVADFLTTTGGTGYVETTWEQRWIQCQADSCSQVWAAPLLWADRSAQWTLARNYATSELEQPDDQTIHLTTHRFGLKDLPWGATGAPPGTARRVVGPDTLDIYRWDGQVYRLESREQVTMGQEIAREFDWQTEVTNQRVYEVASKPFLHNGVGIGGNGYLKQQAAWWGLPTPDQPDDPTWGSASRQPELAADTGSDSLGEWVAQMVGALDKPECRLLAQRYRQDKLTVIGRLDLPCTINFTRLAWTDVTGDEQAELLLTTIPPDEESLGQMERLVVFAVSDEGVTELAHLDGVINGADGRGIRWRQSPQGFEAQVMLPLIDPDTATSLLGLRRERAFNLYRWDKKGQEFKFIE
ncbi:MAG: PD40 domain-containing protein [Anaerolineales bacterium]|nr:PD40 domain-containing protein [Anaerolineales bacterium]